MNFEMPRLQRDSEYLSAHEAGSTIDWKEDWSIADLIATRDYYHKKFVETEPHPAAENYHHIIVQMDDEIAARMNRARLL